MKETKCPNCQEVFKSYKKYVKHLAMVHEAYQDGRDIKQYTWDSLENKKDRTLFILLTHPEARIPKDGPLFRIVLQYYIKATIYDANRKAACLSGPDGYLSIESLQDALSQLGDYGRQKEHLQTADKKAHHRKLPDGSWPSIDEHRCILPSDKQIALGELSQEAHRQYYTPMRNEHI